MTTFCPPTDAFYESLPRQNATRLPTQHRSQLPNSALGLAVDCPRLCAAVGCPANSPLNIASDASLVSIPAMQSDTWGLVSQSTPSSGRHSHQRNSSLSSLGSAGPASPFAGPLSNAQIAINDPATDGFADLHPQDVSGQQVGAFYHFAKPVNDLLACNNLEASISDKMGYPVTVPGPSQKPQTDRALLPAPDFAGSWSRSRPDSVASSAAGDSPATPNTVEINHTDRRRNGRPLASPRLCPASDVFTHRPEHCNVPKLSRTMTDVYGDELYSPNFAITSSTSPAQLQSATSPTNDVFSQRINAANNHHLSTAQSPPSSISRTRSPFRTGSPFVSSSASHRGLVALGSTRRGREEQSNPLQAASSTQQRGDSNMEAEAEPETPKTISPKDAILEFGDTDGSANLPLFPPDPSTTFIMEPKIKPGNGPETDDACMETTHYQGVRAPVAAPAAGFLSRVSPLGLQQSSFAHGIRSARRTPPRLAPSESSSVASSGSIPITIPRPSGTGAESGTYTCTYHGCTFRFETPFLLQKHKREGHRQTQGLSGSREPNIAPGLLNTQSGPHRCDRINPSTGKPCHTVFSRPYDLTRHEDTIHNARKQKVRCDICTEGKTFSRADALTRHYRVCHPDKELPGKHRRHGSA